MAFKSKYKSKYKPKKKIIYRKPYNHPTYFSGDYEDFMQMDEETQDRIAERAGFTDSEEYSDYLWAMDKED